MKKTTKPKRAINTSKFKIDEITLVLIVAIMIIAITITQKTGQETNDAANIMKILLNDNSAAPPDNRVMGQAEMEKIQGMNYEQLKKYLSIKNDFCLYIEDENGNIIMAKGSSKLSRDGIYCKE